jgi:hypothetical protein
MDGQFELGERAIIDPYEPGRLTTRKANVRESAVAHMASRGRLNTSQVEACERFRKLWELAAVGRQRGIDMSSMGGGSRSCSDPISDELVKAGRLLAQAMYRVGPRYSQLLIKIVGEGTLIRDIAKRWAQAGGIVKGRQAAEGYITGTLIDGIDELVRAWGLEGRGKPKDQDAHYLRCGIEIKVNDDIRSSGPMTYTGPAKQIEVGRFGDVQVTSRPPLDRVTLMGHVSGNLGSRAPERKPQ